MEKIDCGIAPTADDGSRIVCIMYVTTVVTTFALTIWARSGLYTLYHGVRHALGGPTIFLFLIGPLILAVSSRARRNAFVWISFILIITMMFSGLFDFAR